MILADGIVGQMMEKVILPPQKPRRTATEIAQECPWAATGNPSGRRPNRITSLELDSATMEENNLRYQATYKRITEAEQRSEEYLTEDAEYLVVAFGSVARICHKAIEEARDEGAKIGLLRPITLWPFPEKAIAALTPNLKGILVVELNAGQMIEDVRLASECRVPVCHYGRLGGIVPNPAEINTELKRIFPDAFHPVNKN